MHLSDAIGLIRDAVGDDGSEVVWADLGAGTGTFTRALAGVLAPDSTIYAVDDDAHALAALRAIGARSPARILPVKADFTRPFELPGLGAASLDGMLLANSLHFVRDAARVLSDLLERVRVGGKVVVVEYDHRAPSRWVPYPIDAAQWPRLAESAGLSSARITATRPSAYAGMLYAGVAVKSDAAPIRRR